MQKDWIHTLKSCGESSGIVQVKNDSVTTLLQQDRNLFPSSWTIRP